MENYCFNITGRIKIVLAVFVFGFVVSSCSDIVEEDISADSVVVVIPQNGSSLTTNNVHFKWDELKGADSYRLQLVEPSFTTIGTFILDSLITNLEFHHILNPGNYEFMLRAENSVYQTPYTGPYAFTVDSVSDLSGQLVPLVSPADGLYTNLSDLSLSWQSIFAADDYEVQVRSGNDFNGSSTILYTAPGITGTSQTTTGSIFGTEGDYSWGVRASNQSSQSSFSSRIVYVDMTNPNDVVLQLPTDASSATSDTVVFKWTSGIDPGTVHAPLSYSLELSTDVAFGTFTPYATTVDTLQLILPTDTYYWRVYGLDDAGNQSAFYSPEYSVIVP